MKKLLCALIAAVILLATLSPCAFAVEKSAGLSEEKIIEIVGALGIMRGDENGNLNLDSRVTRAEFVKMTVCASNYKDDADVKTAYSIFPDVSASHWASGYVRVAVGQGWINGYLDGTFRPSGNVKLEEAANIVLKLLGYTASDFVGSYPDGQMAKYRSLKLNTEISAEQGDELTRRECMYLIYNTLCTKTKSGTPYCQTIGETADSDGNIDYSALMQDKKKGPFVVTDLDAWQNVVGANEKTSYYKNGKPALASDISLYDVLYYSTEFSSVWIFDNRTAGVLESYYPDKNNPTSVTISGVSYTLVQRSDYSGKLSAGEIDIDSAVVLLIGENGCAVEAYPASSAYIASDASELTSNGKIYINDVYSSSNSISEDCLVYSCDEMGASFVYDAKISGIITELSPTEGKPESAVIGSKTYTLSGAVRKQLESTSTFAEKDFVTVYLGKNGQVEYIIHADIYDTEIYKENGLTYESLVAGTLEGPKLVIGDSWKTELGFDAEGADYYIDGRKVDINEVRDYDVVYYSKTFKTVWVCSEKVTGVIEAILPGTVAPSSVTVAGNSYKLETSEAVISFSGKGSFGVGDTVTLIMGVDGIVAAVLPEVASHDFLGISTSVEKKEYTAADGRVYEDYYVTISSFDGSTYSVKTGDSDFDTGILVYASYVDGKMTVREFSTKYSASNVTTVKNALKSGKIAANAVMVDYYGKNFVKIYTSDIERITVTEKNLAYYSFDTAGNIDSLVLKDATGNTNSYGVIINFKGTYNFMTTSQNNSLSGYVTAPTGAVQVKYGSSGADKITALNAIDVVSIDGGKAKSASKSYPLWDYAECFVMEQKAFSVSKDSDDALGDVIAKTSAEYIKTLLAGGEYAIKGYYDATGVVRVLVAQKIK